uniref:SFRICE_015910 n=1 Tax=Spodoptera frugiperda TaxID=7108 RepID=A0A2H1W4L4_SPOFR
MSVPFDMLLHPELLSNEQLIRVIQERHLRVPNLGLLHRDELLDIFHNYCLPHGQRKYRDSGRGKILNKSRQLSPEPVRKLNVMNNQESKVYKGNPGCDRLKPPPDCVSSHPKRIKIETTISPITNTGFLNTNKRKNCAESITTTDSPPSKKERKPITYP